MTDDRSTAHEFTVQLKGISIKFSRNCMVSLLADRQLRLIYVANPKSGCTTIKNVIFYCDRGFPYFDPEIIHSSYFAFWKINKHNYSHDLVNLFNRDDAYVFSVVRHPFHRFISGFVDKLLPGGQDFYFGARDFLCAYAGIDLAGDPVAAAVAYLDWLEKDEQHPDGVPTMSDLHFRRQVDNLGLGSKFPIDFVGKIEEPEPILDMFERIMGLRPTEAWKQRRRVTRHPAKNELLASKRVRAAVERVYESDFRAFGYS